MIITILQEQELLPLVTLALQQVIEVPQQLGLEALFLPRELQILTPKVIR